MQPNISDRQQNDYYKTMERVMDLRDSEQHKRAENEIRAYRLRWWRTWWLAKPVKGLRKVKE